MDIREIKEGLKLPGKSRVGLAAALNVDVSQISRLLNGRRHLKVNEVPIIRGYLYGEAGAGAPIGQPVQEPMLPPQALRQLDQVRSLLDAAEDAGLDPMTTIVRALEQAINAKQRSADTPCQNRVERHEIDAPVASAGAHWRRF